ncbi:MAG: Uncharacterised protein [Cellulomonadaceae bacterium TMED98]|nr:MAG: Uncharacterised protein [Cellulomonadaceae bacterium TMED98]
MDAKSGAPTGVDGGDVGVIVNVDDCGVEAKRGHHFRTRNQLFLQFLRLLALFARIAEHKENQQREGCDHKQGKRIHDYTSSTTNCPGPRTSLQL